MHQEPDVYMKAELAEALEGVVRADGVVRQIEVETCEAIYRHLLSVCECGNGPQVDEGGGAPDRLARLPLPLKRKLVQLCWLLAESDGELHPAEEVAIYDLADRIRLDRKIVAQTQPELRLPRPGGALGKPVDDARLSERLSACA